MSEDQDLRQRRQALEAELGALSDQQERGDRANADAVSRLPAAVVQPEPAQMSEVADEERAADSAMDELRDEINLIADELVHARQFGVTQHDPASMSEFAEDDEAADSAIDDLRRQIDVLDHELAARDGVKASGRRLLWWLRK